MGAVAQKSNRIVAALVTAVWFSLPGQVLAETDAEKVDRLLNLLRTPEVENWDVVESEIMLIWSRSGSATMDLLFKRGQEAMEAEDLDLAIERFSTLIDHAPDFAEGWNARATAYYFKGQAGLAIADIQQVLRLNPRHFGAMTGFALILEEAGRFDEALEVWKAAQAIHPHHPGINEAVERLTRQEEGRDL